MGSTFGELRYGADGTAPLGDKSDSGFIGCVISGQRWSIRRKVSQLKSLDLTLDAEMSGSLGLGSFRYRWRFAGFRSADALLFAVFSIFFSATPCSDPCFVPGCATDEVLAADALRTEVCFLDATVGNCEFGAESDLRKIKNGGCLLPNGGYMHCLDCGGAGSRTSQRNRSRSDNGEELLVVAGEELGL